MSAGLGRASGLARPCHGVLHGPMPRSTTPARSRRSTVSKFFRDRESGKIVVAQAPNLPLWIFLAATAVRLVWHPEGLTGTVLSIVSGAAIVMWSLLEIVRGASPFRRVLGAVVLLAVLGGLVLR